MDPAELEKTRRETMRWRIIQTLHIGSPYALAEDTILQAVTGPDLPGTQLDVRKELTYLEARELIVIDGRGEAPLWRAQLTRHGTDLAEYTIPCEPGIGRPQKYW